MKKKMKKLKSPELVIEQVIEESRISVSELESQTEYRNCKIMVDVTNQNISEIQFTNCTFQGDELASLEFLDVIFSDMDISNMKFNHTRCYRMQFKSCKLTGVQFVESRLKDVEINACNGRMMIFDGSQLELVDFKETELESASFYQVTFKDTQFLRCILNQADFRDTLLQPLDLSTSSFDAIYFTPELAKGLKIDSMQAGALIHNFGLELAD